MKLHSSSIRTNRADKVAVFEGSSIRYNSALSIYNTHLTQPLFLFFVLASMVY